MFDSEAVAETDGFSAPGVGARGTRVAVHGHRTLVDALLDAARSDRIGPPMLLVGPTGVGKRTVARLAAQAILCEAEAAVRPCGVCRTCRLVAADSHADLVLLESPLRIERVRTLLTSLALAPVEGRARVAIIPQVEAASPGAANSLLKTLEEPPSHAVIFLTTDSESDVLPTIRSRCRRLALRPLSVEDASAALMVDHGLDQLTADRAARLGGGSIGECLRWIDDQALLERAGWLDAANAAVGAGRVQRIDLAERLAKAGSGLEGGLRLWLGWWRDALLIRLGARDGVLNVDRMEELIAVGERFEPSAIAGAVRAVENALYQLGAHAAPASVLEVLVLGLPGRADGALRPGMGGTT